MMKKEVNINRLSSRFLDNKILVNRLSAIPEKCSFLSGNDMCASCENLWTFVSNEISKDKQFNIDGYSSKILVGGLRAYVHSREIERKEASDNLLEIFFT